MVAIRARDDRVREKIVHRHQIAQQRQLLLVVAQAVLVYLVVRQLYLTAVKVAVIIQTSSAIPYGAGHRLLT